MPHSRNRRQQLAVGPFEGVPCKEAAISKNPRLNEANLTL